MGLTRVLGNVQKGYAEAYYYDENDREQEHLKYTGMVTLQEIPITVDLHNDEINYLNRWFAYLYVGPSTCLDNGFVVVGRTNTGYASRSLALQGLEEAILDIYGQVTRMRMIVAKKGSPWLLWVFLMKKSSNNKEIDYESDGCSD